MCEPQCSQQLCTISFPFSFTVETSRDFLTFEKKIREFLGCDGLYCSFFQSAEYINLKNVVRMALLQTNHEASSARLHTNNESVVIPIPRTSLIITLLHDCQTLMIKDSSDDRKMIEDAGVASYSKISTNKKQKVQNPTLTYKNTYSLHSRSHFLKDQEAGEEVEVEDHENDEEEGEDEQVLEESTKDDEEYSQTYRKKCKLNSIAGYEVDIKSFEQFESIMKKKKINKL